MSKTKEIVFTMQLGPHSIGVTAQDRTDYLWLERYNQRVTDKIWQAWCSREAWIMMSLGLPKTNYYVAVKRRIEMMNPDTVAVNGDES